MGSIEVGWTVITGVGIWGATVASGVGISRVNGCFGQTVCHGRCHRLLKFSFLIFYPNIGPKLGPKTPLDRPRFCHPCMIAQRIPNPLTSAMTSPSAMRATRTTKKYLQYPSMALFALGASTAYEHHQIVPVHPSPKDIMSVANFQKSGSDYDGYIALYASNSCSDNGAVAPTSSGNYNPSSAPAGCLVMNSDSPISSIWVGPANETWVYFIEGFSDSQCSTEVWSDPTQGLMCLGPPEGVNVWSVYIS
jgi:hypothetical protein